MNRNFVVFMVCVLSSVSAGLSYAGSWSRQGADAGMTKYAPENVQHGQSLQPHYTKRFYGEFGNYTGNYHFASSVVVRDGEAFVLSNDQPYTSQYSEILQCTLFDWQTGTTTASYQQPKQSQYGFDSFHAGEHAREIDSHHYTNPIIWNDDGWIYARRGGDHRCTFSFSPWLEKWYPLEHYNAAPGYTNWGGDTNAFIQLYNDTLIYRPGDTRTTGPYIGTDVSFQALLQGTRGTWKSNLGPYCPDDSTPSSYETADHYGDIPKCAQNISVLSALRRTDNPYPNNYEVYIEACDIDTGTSLWTRSLLSDSGGQQGFYTSVSDYWRYMATEDGHFVFFTRPSGAYPVLHVADLQTGQDLWTYTMNDTRERPLLAYNDGELYMVGQQEQVRFDIDDGSVVWSEDHDFPADEGYILRNWEYGSPMTTDPLYRPMVLTDSTFWFVNGDKDSSVHELVGISTVDGLVVQTIDIAALYDGNVDESFLVVNDLLAADGMLGLLVGVQDANDPYPLAGEDKGDPGDNNHMIYQDLHVFWDGWLRDHPPGDANFDLLVDAEDLATLGLNWAPDGDGLVWADGDFDRDGDIDAEDLAILGLQWNPSGTIPEPILLPGLLLGLAGLVRRR